MAEQKGETAATRTTIRIIEETLGAHKAVRKIEDNLYVVKQGSAYVMLVVLPDGEKRAIVRMAAQVVTGIEMTGELARKLLCMNARLRFGAFGYQKDGRIVTLSHSVLGGETLDAEEILAALEDMALLADELDDKLVADGGGARMQDLLEDQAFATMRSRIIDDDASALWDEE